MHRWSSALAAGLLVLFWAVPALPFKLQPIGTDFDRERAQLDKSRAERLVSRIVDRGVRLFAEPIHEEATQRIYGCNEPYDKRTCATAAYAPPAVIDGVRWNDNPPLQVKDDFILPNGKRIDPECANETIKLPRKSTCWLSIFKASSDQANKKFFSSRGGVMLNRSHFGDLQFLHSMASRVGDKAANTQESILMWAEFVYNVALGEIRADKKLKDVTVPGFTSFFGTQGGTVEGLFLLGDPTYRGEQLKLFAFGTLLHLIQDSFSASHVIRDISTQGTPCPALPGVTAPGQIVKFLVYGAQDAKEHGKEDESMGFMRHLVKDGWSPNVIDVGRELTALYARPAPWKDVKPYIDCVFLLQDPDSEADGGSFGAQ